MNTERPELHSVWLCPEPTIAATLTSLISRIADRQDAPAFSPHVTLLGEISGDPETTFRACKALFAKIGPVEVTVLRVARSVEFFRSLTLELALPQSIPDARVALSRALGQPEAPMFQPHLSLAYGALPGGDFDSVLQDEASFFVGKTIQLDRVVVSNSATSIPIQQWSELEETPLET